MSDQQFPFAETSIYIDVFSYLGLPLSRDFARDGVDAVVMGIPYDLGTTGRPGARSGPNAVRQASANLRWEEQRWPWTFSLGAASRQSITGTCTTAMATVRTCWPGWRRRRPRLPAPARPW